MKNYQTLIGSAVVAAAIVAAAIIIARKIPVPNPPARYQGVPLVNNQPCAIVLDTHTGTVSLRGPE